MLRRALSAALACVLGLSAAPLLAASSASAAQGDVLTAHWWSGDKAGGHVRTPTVGTGTSGGATFSYAGYYIRVLPPSGARFEVGTSYEAASTRTDGHAVVQQYGYSTCTSSQRMEPSQGS